MVFRIRLIALICLSTTSWSIHLDSLELNAENSEENVLMNPRRHLNDADRTPSLNTPAVAAPAPSPSRILDSITGYPTTTYRPTTTWYPTTTSYPTKSLFPTRNHGSSEASLPTSPFPKDIVPTFEPTIETTDSNGNQKNEPRPSGPTSSDDSSSSSNNKNVSSPLTNKQSGGFGFGMAFLVAVFVAMGLMYRYRTTRQSEQQRLDGLELYDIGRRRFGHGYQDVPEASADIRGLDREIL